VADVTAAAPAAAARLAAAPAVAKAKRGRAKSPAAAVKSVAELEAGIDDAVSALQAMAEEAS